jgi:hypothetical protein
VKNLSIIYATLFIMRKNKEHATKIEDAILAGILKAKNHKTTAEVDDSGRVFFLVHGDVRKSLKEIYDNRPIGALDALQNIKSCRALIFQLKGTSSQNG